MADDESFFVSADEADDDGRRAPGHAPPRATPRDPDDASTTTTTSTMARRRLGSDSDDDDAVDRTANETMEDSDASFVSGDDAGGDALGRGARDAGAETTTTKTTTIAFSGDASGTDGEFVSGADTDTGVDGRARLTGTKARAPGRAPPPPLRTRQATGPALSEGEEEAATHSHQPVSPGTMLNEAWELAMRAQDRDRILDEDDPPEPLTLFKDALDEGDADKREEDDDDEEGGFASAGNDGAGDPAGPGDGPGDASNPPGDASDPDRSFGADDSFADPALDLDDPAAGEGDAVGTPSKFIGAADRSLSRSRPAPLSPPSPLIAPSDRASFRLVRQSSAGVTSNVASVAAPWTEAGRDKAGGWGEGGAGDLQTRRMSKAEEVLKAATRHSSDDDDVDELASSSDGEGAGPGRAGGGPSTPVTSSLAPPRLARGLSSGSGGGGSGSGSFSPYGGSDGDFSPHGTHGGSDSASRRTERRRLQKERYLAKLHNGFGSTSTDAESLRRRAEALRRNASSEPEPASSRLRHSWSGGAGGGGRGDRDSSYRGGIHSRVDGRKWLDAGPGGRTRGGFETTGERRGSTRLTASASLRESESAVLAAGRDPRRTRSGGFAGEAIGSPAGGSPMGAMMGSPMGAMMGSPMGAMMGSPGAMPMPAFGGVMGLMAPQMQHAQMQHMIMMQQQMQEQMRRYQEQMQMQMAGMSVQSPQAPVANAATSQGVTEERLRRVFHLVADNADDEVMGLIDAGAVGVDLADDGGNTLLMASCAAGHKRLSRHLVKRGAGLNKRNAEGNTALHFALAMGHVELGDFLVAKGADDGATNNYGMSPFEGLAPEKDGGGRRRQHRY